MAFLEWLNTEAESNLGKERGLNNIRALASCGELSRGPTVAGHRWGKAYTDAQSLEALSYLDPAKAAQQIFDRLHNAAGETDLLRTMDTLIKTRQRLEKLNLTTAFNFTIMQNQADLMAAWASLIQKKQCPVPGAIKQAA